MVTRSAPYAGDVARLVAPHAQVLAHWADPPEQGPAWTLLDVVDVVVVTCRTDVESELPTIERIRELAPMVEIVCISPEFGVDGTVEILRAGVYAVLSDGVAGAILARTIRAAAARRRRGEQRIRELGPRSGVSHAGR